MIAINADVGECGTEIDSQIMPFVDMASIACGGHIGDSKTMAQTVALAKKYTVKIGAHLSYKDKKNFGRISQNIKADKLATQLKIQLQNLQKICEGQQVRIDYIKPHGALYHDILSDFDKFKLVVRLAKSLKQANIVVQLGLIDKVRNQFASQNNIHLLTEVFADRAYKTDGINLYPRSKKTAVFTDVNTIKTQFNHLKNTTKADTICFHSDNPASIKALKIL